MKNVQLKNYKTFKGHDGMRGINANIVYKGRKIASVYDDAAGGCFDYNILGMRDSKEYVTNKTLFEEMQKENNIKTHSGDLDCAISDLCSVLDRKKDENKGILVKTGHGWNIVGYGYTVPTVIKKYTDGLESMQELYDEQIKAKKEVLNKEYLKSQGIKI